MVTPQIVGLLSVVAMCAVGFAKLATIVVMLKRLTEMIA